MALSLHKISPCNYHTSTGLFEVSVQLNWDEEKPLLGMIIKVGVPTHWCMWFKCEIFHISGSTVNLLLCGLNGSG